MNDAMKAATAAPLPGFDAEFHSLDDYIRVITARIWEGRQIDSIARYYSADCAVITPGGTSQGVDAVVRGTLETLQQFPDRRLLCEDIVSAGDAHAGFLSSHRIASTMTHLGDSGPGGFGSATGRPVLVRTVADCVCIGNRIVHEWLVRDQGAMALQLGSTPQETAGRWLAARGAPSLPLWQPPAPAHWLDPMHATPGAQLLADTYRALWRADLAVLQRHADEAIALQLPNGQAAVGVAAAEAFWFGYTAAFSGAALHIDSLAERIEPGRTPRVAMRWRLVGRHGGGGRFGAASGQAVEILGITHAEVDHARGRILREWVLVDEVALWMQILGR
jgi:ketosteroid isomerase-like protein